MSNTSIFKNSFWGTVASLTQNLLYSIFFIIVARQYKNSEFGNYILANTLYGIILSFSSLGLGQWFMRHMGTTDDKDILTKRFYQIQIQSGIFFYIILLITSWVIYGFQVPSQLTMIIGVNIIFDNIIYVVKCINVVSFEQHRTFIISLAEAFTKVLLGVVLLFHHIPVIQLVTLIVILRFATLNLFVRSASGKKFNLWKIFLSSSDIMYGKKIIAENWAFILIGSISILYWSSGNILASKFLSLKEVGDYEISFKLFAMAEIIPLMVSTTIFPKLSEKMASKQEGIPLIYKNALQLMNVYGVLAFLFIHSYADKIIPFLFGEKYKLTSMYTSSMFMTMIIFPMSLLQANLLVANRKEKTDMWLNIVSLAVYMSTAIVGLNQNRELSTINYSIFISVLLFNVLQTITFFKLGWQNAKNIFSTYSMVVLPVASFLILEIFIDKTILFPSISISYMFVSFFIIKKDISVFSLNTKQVTV